MHVTVYKQGCEIRGGERQTKYVHRPKIEIARISSPPIAPCRLTVQCRDLGLRFIEMAEYVGEGLDLFSETEEPEDTLSSQPATISQALPNHTDSSDSADADHELIGNSSSVTPRRPVSYDHQFSRKRKRQILSQLDTDSSQESDEERDVEPRNSAADHGGGSLEEIKGLLMTLCKKVARNEKTLKELQNVQQNSCRLVVVPSLLQLRTITQYRGCCIIQFLAFFFL